MPNIPENRIESIENSILSRLGPEFFDRMGKVAHGLTLGSLLGDIAFPDRFDTAAKAIAFVSAAAPDAFGKAADDARESVRDPEMATANWAVEFGEWGRNVHDKAVQAAVTDIAGALETGDIEQLDAAVDAVLALGARRLASATDLADTGDLAALAGAYREWTASYYEAICDLDAEIDPADIVTFAALDPRVREVFLDSLPDSSARQAFTDIDQADRLSRGADPRRSTSPANG